MITAVVLAAGSASRFGTTKQLAELEGKPLVQHAVDAAEAAGAGEIVVVLGHDAERVRSTVRLPPHGRFVENPDHALGQASSLAAGLRAADPASEAAVVLLADQPGVSTEHVRALLRGFGVRPGPVLRLRFRDGPGPALISRDVWGEVMELEGDTGARSLFERYPEWVEDVWVDEEAPRDVDTRADLDDLSS